MVTTLTPPVWWRGRWMIIGHCPIAWELQALVMPGENIVLLPVASVRGRVGW